MKTKRLKVNFQTLLFALGFSCLTVGNSLYAATVTQRTPPTTPILRVETGVHTDAIHMLVIDRSGRYLVTASHDKTCRVWDARTGKSLMILRPPVGYQIEGRLYTCAISPDGNTVACGGWTGVTWDKTDCVYVFERTSGRMVSRVVGLPNVIDGLAYSTDGRYLAIALGDAKGVRLARTSDYKIVGRDTAYADDCYGCDMFTAADGVSELATASDDGYVRLYKVEANGALESITKVKTTAAADPFCVAFSADGSKIAVGFYDRPIVSIFPTRNMFIYNTPDFGGRKWGRGGIQSVRWSGDGLFLCACGANIQGKDVICEWDNAGSGGLRLFGSEDNSIVAATPTNDGGMAYAVSDGKIARLDRMGNPVFAVQPTKADFGGNWRHFAISPDADAVSFGFRYGGSSPAYFSIRDRKLSSLTGERAGPAAEAVLLPQRYGQQLSITGGLRGVPLAVNGVRLGVEDSEVPNCYAVLTGDENIVVGASWYLYCFSRSGKTVWKRPLPGPARAVNASDDGRIVVAALGDGTIRWYRTSDATELLALFPAADEKRWILWTPYGYYDCSLGADDLIGWNVNRGADKAAAFYPASLYRKTYYRPDVISLVLGSLDSRDALRIANTLRDATRKTNTALPSTGLPNPPHK